jgi:hypothetical protein
MLYNRIAKKKVEMHKAITRPLTDKLWTEIETLQLVLSESLSIRRLLLGDKDDEGGRYYYKVNNGRRR